LRLWVEYSRRGKINLGDNSVPMSGSPNPNIAH
jgi:hypothetical protein